ncbi:MAG: DMT family transporter [Desulfobacteraceae bacterium]|nr:DMT family transporter [Desulfobacteraceae bacterium]
MSKNEMPFVPSLFTAFVCMLFGANTVAIKISLSGLGAFTTAGLRFSIAAVAILLWAKFKGQSLKINKKQIFQLLMLSQLFVIQSSCIYIGLTKTTASHAVLITNLMPFVVLMLAHYFIPGERISFKKGVGVSLGFLVPFI